MFRDILLCFVLAIALVHALDVRILVTYRSGTKTTVQKALIQLGATFHHEFDKFDTLVVTIPETNQYEVENNENVLLVEDDCIANPIPEETGNSIKITSSSTNNSTSPTVSTPINLLKSSTTLSTSSATMVPTMAPTRAQSIPYSVNMIHARELLPYDGSGIKICLVDSGVDITHPDLAGLNITGETVDQNEPWTVDSIPSGDGHGTSVVGVIAAQDNHRGIVGVSPGVSIHMVKAFGKQVTYASGIVAAAQKCRDAGANIINLSLVHPYRASIALIYKSIVVESGILVIAAAGNDGTDVYMYPASYEWVVSVTAVDQNKKIASFSNFNTQSEIAAPGVNIFTLYKGGLYEFKSGTSFSSPNVAGAAALVWQAHPTETNSEIRTRLVLSASDLGIPGRDEFYGFGLVDAAAAADMTCSVDADCDDLNPCTLDTCNSGTCNRASVSPTVCLGLQELTRGVPVTIDAAAGEFVTTWLPLAGSGLLGCQVIGGNNTADLYVQYDAIPQLDYYECQSTNNGNFGLCVVDEAKVGANLFVSVYANANFSNVNVLCNSCDSICNPLDASANCETVSGRNFCRRPCNIDLGTCAGGEVCDANKCVGDCRTNNLVCDDSNNCTTDVCNVDGTCKNILTCQFPVLPFNTTLVLNASAGDSLVWYMPVAQNDTVHCSTRGSIGDADLYLKFDGEPSMSSFDCQSISYNSNENCSVGPVTTQSFVFVLVKSYAAFSDVLLTCCSNCDPQQSEAPSSSPLHTLPPTVSPTVYLVPSLSPGMSPSNLSSQQPSVRSVGPPSSQPVGQPSNQPVGQTSSQPVGQPSNQPAGQTSSQPVGQPSSQPVGQPSSQPVSLPSSQPVGQPSVQPSGQLLGQPTGQPTFIDSPPVLKSPTGAPGIVAANTPSAVRSSSCSGVLPIMTLTAVLLTLFF